MKTCNIPFMNPTAAVAKQFAAVLLALELQGYHCIILWPQFTKLSYFSRWEMFKIN